LVLAVALDSEVARESPVFLVLLALRVPMVVLVPPEPTEAKESEVGTETKVKKAAKEPAVFPVNVERGENLDQMAHTVPRVLKVPVVTLASLVDLVSLVLKAKRVFPALEVIKEALVVLD
jgi:hypothetical protein